MIRVRLTEGPIRSPAPFHPPSLHDASVGAVLVFEGRVRGSETIPAVANRDEDCSPETKPIIGLEYQVYEPMTTQELQRLTHRFASDLGVLAVDVEHSHGFVGNGECSFVLQVAAAHRSEAIRFVDEFIEAMKQHVPIWKIPRWSPPLHGSVQ